MCNKGKIKPDTLVFTCQMGYYGVLMANDGVVVRFDDVSFEFSRVKPILEHVSFSVRKGSKITLMGQNGAGKSTIFKILTGEFEIEDGSISLAPNATIAIARQVIPRDQLEDTLRDFFQKCFKTKQYDIDKQIEKILDVVHLEVSDYDKQIKTFSGGQQARILLASALIQSPDILLLDEPTNNLDHAGIDHLTQFLKDYQKTVLVISHDADFLNSFSDGVLYLDVFTRKVEQYSGNYKDVVEQIVARVEKERRKNAQLEKNIQDKKDKANFFANKGGRMRMLAKRMREEAAEDEENKVDVRREDKTIRPFVIPCQENLSGEIFGISSFTCMVGGKIVKKIAHVSLKKDQHLQFIGPNGIGKSTLLEAMATGKAEGATIAKNIVVGYYRQDFSTLDFNQTVYESLGQMMKETEGKLDEEKMRSIAAAFLITGDVVYSKIGTLSEGQKGLVAFARLVIQKPGLLILDEPTNHINFRHLPVIAKALDQYKGAMILVSHVPEFVSQIRIDEVLDLGK